MDLEFKGKSVLVTAASKGIGYGIAEAFADEGAKVAICARGEPDLHSAAEALRELGGDVLAVRADTTVPDDVERVVNETNDAFGRIDVLVNNAGEAFINRSFDLPEAEWEASIALNLMSAVRFTRLVVPQMKTRESGAIVNISSVSGHTVMPKVVDYQTMKAALIAYSKSMAIDLARHRIRVNCVCPGPVHTPLWDRLADDMAEHTGRTREQIFDSMTQQVPLRRYGTVREVGDLVAFLASNRASYITGVAYDVDGGVNKSTF